MNWGWKDRLTSRQTKYGLNAALYILAALAIVVILNLIAIRIPTRIGQYNTNWQWDLTANKRYSLSQEAVQILSNLKQDVEVLYFDRKDQFGNLRDLLDQFPGQSRHLTVTYVDPDREPNKANQYSVKTYGEVLVASAGKTERAKGTKEEDIINSIIRVLQGETKTIYFLQGHGERQLDSTERLGYSEAKKGLEEVNYKVETLSLLQEKPEVPLGSSLLVIAGPQKEFLDPEIDAIRTYLKQGGRVLLLLTPMTPPKLVSLFKEFGADISNNLVVDVSGIGRLFGTDELMPLALQYEDHVITKDMANVATMFPFANAMKETAEPAPGASFQLIAKTTTQSWATRDVNAREVSFREGTDMEGPLALAGVGTYHDPGAPMAIQGRYVVLGSADIISNAILNFNGNRDLFLNSIAWLASQEDLISIRPKDPDDRPVELTPEQLRLVKYFALVFMPLAIVAGGLGVWWKRRG
jgi:ABC-type uncharacterized transport system involved in gliding motility auxiliary subunit